ncbi:DUF4468 domain-containing protein [Moraxella boevrei]|uniref:DUF4468 domain-containing protein n=1 Tax=Faucicola boevrei TaxID=346665 RepID=UPI003735B801
MMKKLVFGSILAFGLVANAQAKDEKQVETLSQVQQVVEIPNISKDKIYSNSKQWVAINFKSANDVIQMDDKESGVLIGKGNFNYPCKGWSCLGYDGDLVTFTVKIEVKDNKSRITFSDINHHVPKKYVSGTYTPEYDIPIVYKGGRTNLLAPVKEKFDDLIKDYQNTVIQTAKANDEW